MTRNSRLSTLVDQKPMTKAEVSRLWNGSRHESHQPASSRPQRNVRPVETNLLDNEEQAVIEKAGKK
jgi:hypothetical protein